MRKLFDQELERLNTDLAEMGRRVDSLMQGTIQCLKTMDVKLAKTIFESDSEINAMEGNIEQSCMNLLALQQPLAHDLRTITATLKIVTDMERIGDQCADICEILTTVAGLSSLKTSPRLLMMFEKARAMFAGSLDAYLRNDTQLAEKICKDDDEVDELFSAIVLELCSQISDKMTAIPENVDYLFIAKYIERIADHATNIGEWTIFIQSGIHPNLNHA